MGNNLPHKLWKAENMEVQRHQVLQYMIGAPIKLLSLQLGIEREALGDLAPPITAFCKLSKPNGLPACSADDSTHLQSRRWNVMETELVARMEMQISISVLNVQNRSWHLEREFSPLFAKNLAFLKNLLLVVFVMLFDGLHFLWMFNENWLSSCS